MFKGSRKYKLNRINRRNSFYFDFLNTRWFYIILFIFGAIIFYPIIHSHLDSFRSWFWYTAFLLGFPKIIICLIKVIFDIYEK